MLCHAALCHAVQVTQIMVPLLKFYFNEDVRASAAQVNKLLKV